MYTAFNNLTVEDIKALQELTPKKSELYDKLQYILDEIAPVGKNGKLQKPFSITSVCRADIIGQKINGKKMTQKTVLKIDDYQMERIASKMANAYCDSGFWIDLPIIVEDILE